MKVNPVLDRWRLKRQSHHYVGVLRVAGEAEATQGSVERPERHRSSPLRGASGE